MYFELQTFCLMKGQDVVNSCFLCICAEKDIYIYIYIVYTEFSKPGQIPKYVIRCVIKYNVL